MRSAVSGNYHPYVDQVKFTAYIYRHVDWFCSSAPKMNRDNWRLIRDSRLNFTINRANAGHSASRCPRGAAPRLVTALSLTNTSCASHRIYRANRPGSGHPHSLYSATITPIMEATCGDESFLR